MDLKNQLYASYEAPKIFGIQLRVDRSSQFIILTLLSIIFSVIFSLLQERAFLIPGFNFSGFATFLFYLTFALCARIEAFPQSGLRLKIRNPLAQYVLVASCSVIGLWANNMALVYIDYVTKIVAKSIKVLPVFVFATIVQGRKYTRKFYVAILLLAGGLVAFLAGESSKPLLSKAVFSAAGIFLVVLSLVCDSLYANLEEKYFFKIPKPIDPSEILEVTSLLAAAATFAVTAVTGEFAKALAFSREHPDAVTSTVISAAAGYISASLALTLIKHFGAGNTEIAKSLRKIVQVVCSIVVFGKTLSVRMAWGLVVIAFSLAWIHKLYSAGNAVKSAPVQIIVSTEPRPAVEDDGEVLRDSSVPARRHIAANTV